MRFTIPKNLFKFKKYKLRDSFEDIFFELGYNKKDQIYSYGDFSKRGYIRDIYIPIYEFPVRLELFDDEIERISIFDPISQKSIKNINEFVLTPAQEINYYKENIQNFEKRISELSVKFSQEKMKIIELSTLPAFFYNNKETIYSYFKEKPDIYFVNYDNILKNYKEKEKENIEMCDNDLKKFIYKSFSGKTIEFINQMEFKTLEYNFKDSKSIFIKKEDNVDLKLEEIPLIDWEDLEENDLVVHEDYGIGIFKGIQLIKTALGQREYLTIEYKNNSKVFVPAERLDKISKYIGDIEKAIISNINSTKWKNTKKKVSEEVKNKIKELIQTYAIRENNKGISIVGDYELEEEFKKTFPYLETYDQMKSIDEISFDLKSDKPMDRLLVGDAGFGKTEVALRAAFKTIISNYQVILLAPTTILANQHYKTFSERMNHFGIKVGLLNRLKTENEKRKIIEDIKLGKIDIIIGTHSLLSDKIIFNNPGLIIVDEEQRFGVLQKEKHKNLNKGINFLSMSATPIPRTMYMSISGLRDISIISTPPIGRIPIQTYVGQLSSKLVRTAILREKSRGGQSIYVHNRVNGLKRIYKELKELTPELNISYAHGNMRKMLFEKTIKNFYEGNIDLLISTTIIENGIDIPNANTIIVDDSYRYGISQLYQLKGRVGRSKRRAFSYFLYDKDKITNVSNERLKSLKKYNDPGSGMKLALRDLEIRGYGDILGLEQKGKINSVGLHMYKTIMEKTLNEFFNNNKDQNITFEKFTELKNIVGSIIIPERYIENSFERMRIYRRLSITKKISEIEDISNELIDRFGKYPKETDLLIRYTKIRIKATEYRIDFIEFGDKYIKFKFDKRIIPKESFFRKGAKKVIYHKNENEIIVYGIFDSLIYLEKIFFD